MLTQHTYFNLMLLPIPLLIKYRTIRSTCRTLIPTLQLMGMPRRQVKLSIHPEIPSSISGPRHVSSASLLRVQSSLTAAVIHAIATTVNS